MLDEEAVAKLADFGARYSDRINDVLLEADDLRALSDKQLTVAVIIYASALAKLTKLDLEDFLSLATNTFQRVEITKKETPDA